jgi:hypothetical protein
MAFTFEDMLASKVPLIATEKTGLARFGSASPLVIT